jgi:hypothetical protein
MLARAIRGPHLSVMHSSISCRRADFDTDESLDAGDFVTPSACLVAGNSPPIVAVLSSSMNSSSWTAGSATPYDDRGGMANSQSVPDGFYISGPGYGQLSGYSPTVFTHSDPELVGSDRPQTVVGIPSTRTSAESFSAIGITSSGINITNVTTNANGSTTEFVTFVSSGVVFNDTFDASVSQAYKNCVLSAEQAIATEWTNSITINEEFSAPAQGLNGELASNQFYVDGVSYTTLKSALVTLAAQEPNNFYLQQAVAHLPSTDPSAGAGFELALPYARMLGLTSTT